MSGQGAIQLAQLLQLDHLFRTRGISILHFDEGHLPDTLEGDCRRSATLTLSTLKSTLILGRTSTSSRRIALLDVSSSSAGKHGWTNARYATILMPKVRQYCPSSCQSLTFAKSDDCINCIIDLVSRAWILQIVSLELIEKVAGHIGQLTRASEQGF